MNKEHARELAIQILDEFEELLDEHSIMIPSADRTGRVEEACLYGEAYWQLEDAIADILIELPKVSVVAEHVWDAGHPLRSLAIRICGEFEELLAQHDIKIPSSDRTGDLDEACLYGSEYYALEDAIVDILVDAARNKERQAPQLRIDDEARHDVRAMRRAMANAPIGLVQKRR